MHEPFRPPPGAGNRGSAGLARPPGQRWEIGVVLVYNAATHTATVRTNRGRPLQDLGQLKPTTGSYDHLATGTTVVISWDLGWPIIVGCVDDVGLPQAAIPSMSLTGVAGVGSDDMTQTTRGSSTYKPASAPVDMGPGDWAQVGAMGNHVAVLEGGTVLVGSPTAQIRSFGASGVLQSVARQVQQLTDFGQLRTENNAGKTSFVLRAGSNQTTETGLDEQNWTIRLDLGATGDLLDFQILEPTGKVLFRLHAGADGRVQLYGDGGVDISSGAQGTGEARNDIEGSRTAAISGDDARTVTGAAVTRIGQAATTTIGGDATRAVGGSVTEYAAGDRAAGAGGAAAEVVGKARTVQIGEDDTLEIGGKWSVLAKKSVLLSTNGNFVARAREKAQLDGKRVVLGAQGKHPLPKFDVFLDDFGKFLNTLTSALGNTVPVNPFAVPATMIKLAVFTAKVRLGAPYKSTRVHND